MQIDNGKGKENNDPIVSPSDSPVRKSKKRRAGYFIIAGLCIIALLALAEWLINGTIMLSKTH